ncbi:hypothetical protein CSKR_203800 [Clonorchis sinensis]|uniref:Uncharacterized protein n=1 Tax=Clonorchis sinensis TaxID=79923 RepID=A0A8T1N1B6_CLOSI|nr:hypothetical protein CSKR_203800 [Clonorchis sinensis]
MNRNRFVNLVSFLLVNFLYGGLALQCYECVNCELPIDPQSVEVRGPCTVCGIAQMQENQTVVTTVAGCWANCNAQDTNFDFSRLIVRCCFADLCNIFI